MKTLDELIVDKILDLLHYVLSKFNYPFLDSWISVFSNNSKFEYI